MRVCPELDVSNFLSIRAEDTVRVSPGRWMRVDAYDLSANDH